LEKDIVSFVVSFKFDFAAFPRLQRVFGVKDEGEVAGDGEAGLEGRIIIYDVRELSLAGEIAGKVEVNAVGYRFAEKGAGPEVCPFTSCHISLSAH
jgi:hypothetical protein